MVQTARAPREPLVVAGAIDHHVGDMTATFAADVTLAAAQVHLARENQWLPIDGDPAAPLGELVERNSTGPLRLGYGAWRDLLLGCQFRNGSGELITAGGRTMKNVAGYDLTKLMVGQYGIFGKLVTLTTRTYRQPEATLLATFEPDAQRLRQLLASPARPQWSLLSVDSLFCGYLGDSRTIDFYESDVRRHAPRTVRRQSLDEDIEFRAAAWRHGRIRASVPPMAVTSFIRAAGLTDWVADPAFGIVISSSAPADTSQVRRAAESLGGSVIFFDGDGRPTTFDTNRPLLQRLKHAFDPGGALAPLPGEMP